MQPEDVRRQWAERSGRFSPAYYAQLGPNEVSETLGAVLTHYATTEAAILEIGCGSGRHLEYLRKQGFQNLTGIDINEDAFDTMAEHYPRLAETGTFHAGAIEETLPDLATDAFDVVYSVETLQHVSPEETWVFEELPRLTGDLLITAENEGNSPNRGRTDPVSYVDEDVPLYHRDWKQIFTELGAAQLICEPTARDTIRVFRVLE